MAKRTNPKPAQATGQTKPEAQPPSGAAAPTGAATAAPVTEPTTVPAAAGTVGQTAAAPGQGATSPAAVVNETKPPAEAKPVTVIVTGPKAGRWRAKRFFGPAPTSINVTDLTETELALIMGDPLLTAKVVDAPH